MKTTTKRCLWAFLISVECAWAQVVAYAAITWFLLDKCDHDTKKQLWLIVSIILGRLVLDVAVRLLLPTPIDTAFESVIAITTILLTWLCQRTREFLITILAIVFITVLNSVVHHAWLDFIATRMT